MNRFYATLLLCLTLVALRPNVGFAIILYDTGDPSANTTRPNGPNGFGWDFQGQIGSFLGTAIAPNYFITAQHFGIFANGTNFTYQGSTFQTTASFTDTGSDLVIYQVNGTFNSYASLYTNAGGEVGQGLYVFGRGTQRGAQILVGSGNNQHLAGWGWGASDGVQRWGQNTVSAVENGFVEAAFDQISGVNEAALSAGDSGGGLFIQDGGVWKLAGINYAVSGPYSYNSDGSGAFNASLFDARGLYENNGTSYTLDSGSTPVPSLLAATEIAGRLSFIDSVVVPEPGAGWCVLAGLSAWVARVVWRRRTRRGHAAA